MILTAQGNLRIIWEILKKNGLFLKSVCERDKNLKATMGKTSRCPLHSDLIKEWRVHTGHTYIERHIALSKPFDDVLHSERALLQNFLFIPCITAKAT